MESSRIQRQRVFQKESFGMLRSMRDFRRFLNWILPGVKQKRHQAPMTEKKGKEEFMVPFPRFG